MVGMVLRDWKANYKEALMKALPACVEILIFGIWGFLGVWMGEGDTESKFLNYMAALELIPILFMYAIQAAYPNWLSKNMFLMPLGWEEKKKYLLTNYGAKLVFVFGLHMILTVFRICNGFSVKIAVLLLLNGLLLNSVLGIQMKGKEKVPFSYYGVQFFGLFSSISLLDAATEGDDLIVVWMIIPCFLMELILSVRIFRKEFFANLQTGCDYEALYLDKEKR